MEQAREYSGCELVPTMGALHAGHGALIAEARSHGEVVVSIFVNPIQFRDGEDFDEYPRDLEADLEFCRRAGVRAVFAPSAEEMYSKGFSTSVTVAGTDLQMEGRIRPGHFVGVTTVVAKLFGIFRPRAAYFGWKDAQQLLILKQMTADLSFDTRIMAIETVREPDGLALSSRNRRLSEQEREKAPELFRALKAGEAAAAEGGRIDEVLARARRSLMKAGLREEYLEAVPLDGKEYLLAVAVKMDKTRLIDNIRVKLA